MQREGMRRRQCRAINRRESTPRKHMMGRKCIPESTAGQSLGGQVEGGAIHPNRLQQEPGGGAAGG